MMSKCTIVTSDTMQPQINVYFAANVSEGELRLVYCHTCAELSVNNCRFTNVPATRQPETVNFYITIRITEGLNILVFIARPVPLFHDAM